MAVAQTLFGALPDGRRAELFTLSGASGVTVKITNYGGIVVSLQTPDRRGGLGEIGCGFESLDNYLKKRNYYGAIIGRVANRIGGGSFTLAGERYQLYRGEDGNHLHGGDKGFNARLWTAGMDGERLKLTYVSPDGEEHYPGEVAATVWYSLVAADLRLDYEATTDRATIVNMTNHTFFNLNCCERDILSHEVRIQADAYTPVDADLIPTGEIAPVQGTPLDFTAAKPIGRDLEDIPEGYDHNFIFSRTGSGLEEWLVDVHDPDTGRTLNMATTEPCVQFYIGNFMDGTDIGIGGKAYKRRFAFCLEAQRHPDAVNHPNFGSVVLQPGETYRQTTIYRFGAR